jgi:hypothetical protein
VSTAPALGQRRRRGRLEGDDSHATAAPSQGTRNPAQHASRSNRSAERIDVSADLLEQFETDAHVPIHGILVVKLIRRRRTTGVPPIAFNTESATDDVNIAGSRRSSWSSPACCVRHYPSM